MGKNKYVAKAQTHKGQPLVSFLEKWLAGGANILEIKRTFAYGTVKDRIPRILTKLVDGCHKEVRVVEKQHGEDGCKDALEVVGCLSQLRSEIMTDKPIKELPDNLPDVKIWNQRLDAYRNQHESGPSWFKSPWLYIECFMYRKVQSILSLSKYMSTYDPFSEQKRLALEQSTEAVRSLLKFLENNITQIKESRNDGMLVKRLFCDFVQISLWGNKCDLSISGGEENSQSEADPHENLESLHPYLLVNDMDSVWKYLKSARTDSATKVTVDIVLDNAGFEIVTDFVLAEFLLQGGLADRVRFYPKMMPWFVSDVTPDDFDWTLERLMKDADSSVSGMAERWRGRVRNGTFVIEKSEAMSLFWSLPDAYFAMRDVSPALHDNLAHCDLVVFKGDLNYRKLVGDLDWPHTTTFRDALRGFVPAPLVSLRTLKANVVVGLEPGQAEAAEKEDENWMVTGKYGVIQACLG